MNRSRLKPVRLELPPAADPSRGEGEDQPLGCLLERVIAALQQMHRTGPHPPRDGRPRAAIRRWSDAGHDYLETRIQEVPWPEIDISIQEGLVFIRIAR